MADDFSQYRPLADKFIDFVNSAVTPFHAVDTARNLLLAAGFEAIREKDKWNVKPGGKYFFTRNQSTIVAFAVGGKYQPGNGFSIVGAHTDSPNLKLKPNFTVNSENYQQIGIEPYGGGLWTTWFDRDLTVGGRVIVKKGDEYHAQLVKIDRPILRIPTLAVHLDREAGTKFEINKQDHLLPVIATAVKNTLGGGSSSNNNNNTKEVAPLMKLLASELKVDVNDIRDFELLVFDTQKSVIGGLNNEFIFSPRLDNLMMSFCSLTGLLEALKSQTDFANESNVWAITLFDNEEVGSETAHGAASPMTEDLIRRVTAAPELYELAIRRSFFISADMAHALHPNYSGKHEAKHRPLIHQGPVIKENANQRYATTAVTAFVVRELAQKAGVPLQDFVVRNDSLCGSTIGPIVSASTGVRTVDIGLPQLSMHSIREMCGTADVTHGVNLLRSFFVNFTALDKQIIID